MTKTPTIFCKHEGASLLAFGVEKSTESLGLDDFVALDDFVQHQKGEYIFGFLTYDLKNKIEDLTSSHNDRFGFPSFYFFVPTYVVRITDKKPTFIKGELNEFSKSYVEQFLDESSTQTEKLTLAPRVSKRQYLQKVEKLQEHIQQGDIYEVTFCQEFYAENCTLNPYATFWKLEEKTNAPFASFVHWNNRFLLSGSPERFLKKEGRTLISQPIKGTAKRGENIQEDQRIKDELRASEKERAENIMIVDLVRNDLSRIAEKASVEVRELCGLYSFNTVHQLISTVQAQLKSSVTFSDLLKALFPMGSMTGAPKISAMELIEAHESFFRGLFSGSVGFIAPNGDFDFNVVIRSIFYHQDNNYVSCPVGGAITKASDPELEFEECLLKVKAMQEILRNE